MKPEMRFVAIVVFGCLVGGADTASAAWNNVFQTCCHNCRSNTSSSFFAPAPCPTTCATITYQQRCFYQPVTTYKTESYMEPVTTYRTSFFFEPVTTYRYTSYYDPCTCSCKQVCTPVTSYRLRSQCNAVQSYVQRCRLVPVTEMRQSFYLEPVITYSSPACPPNTPTISETPSITPPINPRERMPQIKEGQDMNERIDPQGIKESRNRAFPPPPVKNLRLDKTASLEKNSGKIEGTVVFEDRITPRSDAKLLFVSATDRGSQFTANTNEIGQFGVTLPSGDWLMYVTDQNGKSDFHSKLTIQRMDDRVVTVVSR
jgi:hypothetical protein